MLKTYDMRSRKATAVGRSFWLWFVATALIVLSMAVSPNVAFGDEAQDVPEGVITFVDESDTGSSPAAVEQEPGVASTSQEEIPEGIVTFEESDAVEESQNASNDVLTENNASEEQEAPENTVASMETPQEQAEQQNAQEPVQVQENSDNNGDEELASNSNSTNNVEQAIEEEPAISPIPVEDEQVTIPASDQPATQETIVTDAPANAPPTEITASNDMEAKDASTDINNGFIHDVATQDTHSTSSSTLSASGSTAVSLNSLNAEGTVSAQSYSVTVYFQNYPAGMPNKAGDEISSTYIAQEITTNDPIFLNVTGTQKLTDTSASPKAMQLEGSESLPNLFRSGYSFVGYFICSELLVEELGTPWMQLPEGIQWENVGELVTEVYVVWAPQPTFTLSVVGKNNQEIAHDDSASTDVPWDNASVNVWSSIVQVPFGTDAVMANGELDASKFNTTTFAGGINTSNFVIPDGYVFKGWMAKDDTVEIGLTSAPWARTTAYTGAGKWDRLISSDTKYADAYHLLTSDGTKLAIFTGGGTATTLTVCAVFEEKPTVVKQYTVTYKNTDGSGVANGQKSEVTHGTQLGQTETAKYISDFASFTAPSDAAYKYKFAGWSTSAGGSVAVAGGGSLADVWGPGSPENAGTGYELYAVWTKIPQTYTVIYNPNGYTGTGINAVTEDTHQIANASSENIKNYTDLWDARSGYQFDGWATSATGAATISAGTPLSTALSPAADQIYSLWAVWTALTYTVNFDYNGGTGPSTTSYTNDVGATTLPSSAPSESTVTKTGYIFKGWTENGTLVADKDNNIIAGTTLANATPSSTHNLVAKWDEITYTINWYAKWETPDGSSTKQPVAGASATSTGLAYSSNQSTTLASLADALDDSLTATYEQEESNQKVTYTWAGWYITVNGSIWSAPATGNTPIGNLTVAQAFNTSGATKTLDELANKGTITIYGIWTSASSLKRTITYQKWTSPDGGSYQASKYQGEDYRIDQIPVDVNGYTFTGWKQGESGPVYSRESIAKTESDSTNTIYNIQYSITLTGQWSPNTVKFNLLPGATDDTIKLKKVKELPDYVTATVNDTITASDLSSGPTRDGYDFAGWRKSSGSTAIIGPKDTDATYTVQPADAPSNNQVIDLVAMWTPWTYTVRYYKNQGSDDISNTVKVYKKTAPGNWTSLGTQITTDPYTWSAKTAGSDTGLNDPDIILTRDWYKDRNLVEWGLTSSATTGISGSKTLVELYADQQALDGRTNRIVDLYAIWVPITYTVRYQAKNSNGTVDPTVEEINLAKLDSVVQGSTATATASGYDLAVPTWTDVNGVRVDGCSDDAKQALYKPTVEYLRSLYTAIPSSTECTFYANFTEAKYAYKIQAFMQKADGTWNSVFTTPNDIEITKPGGLKLEAPFGTTINASDIITGTTLTAINGKPLSDIVLYALATDSVSNQYLYEFDTTQGVQKINSISTTEADNVLKLYYKRMTYNLVPEFKTKDENNFVTNSAPSSITSTAATYVNDGSATTSLLWGQNIKLAYPVASGYSFAWALTSPSGSTSTITQPTELTNGSFALNAADMQKIATAAASTNAVLTGTFTVVQYKITLTDGTGSTQHWKDGDAAARSQLTSSGTTYTYVPSNKNISTWLPSADDREGDTTYLAGWKDVEDPEQTVIAPDELRARTNWTKDTSFVAVWLPKVVVSYNPGDLDSYGNSKAAWIARTTSLITEPDYSKVLLSDPSKGARFDTLVGSVDSQGKPLGAEGWEFDYWTIDGTDTTGGYLVNWRYGQTAPYTGTNASPWFLDGTNAPVVNGNERDGILLARSLTFIAHWKPVAQTVNVNNSGPVVNNPGFNEGPVTATLSDPNKTYYTDDLVDMADYAPTVVPGGYELVGWDWTFVDSNGVTTTGTYNDKNATFHVKHGQSTTLKPRFNEKTVTFNYEIASTSSERGTISPVGSDTVFVVTHNGINAHTATSSNSDAYSFLNWTYDSSTVTTDAELTAAKMADITSGTILSGDRTYYANFKAIPYKITFDGTGTDGTNSMGGVSVSGTGEDLLNNGFDVGWNETIKGQVTVTVPEGYEFDGWIVDGAGDPQVFTGGDATNNQGIYNYKVTKNVNMTAHFKVSSQQNYTVMYSYDNDTTTGSPGFSGSEASRKVAWGESVLPAQAGNKNPVLSGFTFKGWYIDAAHTIAITGPSAGISDEFGKIFNKLASMGAVAPNYDPVTKSITIYGKWQPKDFNLTYDLYGRDTNGIDLPYDASAGDNVVKIDPSVDATKTDVSWTAQANDFKLTSGDGTFKRPGYTLAGWYATYVNKSGSVVESYSTVGNETYGELAGGAEENAPVTLHAIWKSQPCTVQYIYNNGFAEGGMTAAKSATRGWSEQVDYYSLGFTLGGMEPTSYEGYKFVGWTVEYTIDTPTTHTEIRPDHLKAPTVTTIRDLVNEDVSALGSGTVVWFKAHWVQQSYYKFQDRLVHLDGSVADKDVTSVTPIDGNQTVSFDLYGTPKTTYNGYDFDNHIASNPNFNLKTANEITVGEGESYTFYVYYLERSYNIDYFLEPPASPSAVGNYRTEGNAWDSAPAQLPTALPSKAGYTFDGWYLTTTNSPDDGAKLDGTNSIFATGVYTTAPANKSTLKAIAKWVATTVTVEWDTAGNGTTNPAPGSVSGSATDGDLFNNAGFTTITAVPAEGGDYVFEKWTYEYTDPSDSTVKTGDLTSSSPFAALRENGEVIMPMPWSMHTGEDAVWHNIKFTAHFALSSALTVTINYYRENGDKLAEAPEVRYELTDTVTKRDAVDGAYYTFTPVIPDGYKLNEGLTKSKDSAVVISGGDISKMYDFEDSASQVFNVYLEALKYTVTYKYTLTDGTTDQTASTTPALPTSVEPLTSFNNGDFVTGQTHTVSAVPTHEGYEFNGWYFADAYGTPVTGTFAMPAKDVVLVGTWVVKNHKVHFVNAVASDPAVVAGCTVTETDGGYTVQYGSQVKTATNPGPDATTLNGLGVYYSLDKPYVLTGWDILIGGVKQNNDDDPLGAPDVLQYVVKSDVTFRAVWSPTYAVIYARGAHGNFTDNVNTAKTFVEYSSLIQDEALPAYAVKGTLDSNNKPNAVDGWEWVGWGSKDNAGNWTYYFADEADVDYDSTTGTHVTTGLPATVTSNIEFVGFYKALDRTLIFSMRKYKSGVAAGSESDLDHPDPQPTPASGVATSYVVKTGQNARMLDTTEIEREGYTLMGWTDGSKTYTPGSTTEFVMPDGPTSQYVYLYPVFDFAKVEITYAVDSEQTSWGDLDNTSDTLNNPGDPLKGSKPTAKPGYKFDYWTKGTDTTHLVAADGLQSDGKLVPTGATGTVTFVAHFKQEAYDLAYAHSLGLADAQETLPTPALPTGRIWTANITLGTPARAGYDFGGWDVYKTSEWAAYAADPANIAKPTALHTAVAAGATTVSALSNSDGTAQQLTLVPTWAAKAYKVIFNDGKSTGTGTVTGMPAVNPRNCSFDSDDIDASAPSRDGYTFQGWSNSVKSNTVAAGTLTYSDLVNSEDDPEVTLTAIWKAIAHTLTYQEESDDVWSSDSSKYPAGDPIFTGELTDPTAAIDSETDKTHNLRTGAAIARTGSKLLGWKNVATNAEYLFVEGVTLTLTMPDDDVVLAPIWQESGDYNVYFLPGADASEVLNMPGNRKGIAFSTSNIDMSAPKRPGYTFNGWSSDVAAVPSPAAGTGKKYADLVNNDDTITSVTLTATWTEANDYQVKFDQNTSDEVTSMPGDQFGLSWGSTVKTLDYDGTYLPGRSGYTFQGWIIRDSKGNPLGGTENTYFNAASAKFSELAQGEDLPERKVLTLVAQWEAKTFTVEFVEDKPVGASGSVVGMPETNPVTGLHFNSDSKVTAPTLTLAGYEFKGWSNSATGEIIAAGEYDYPTLANNDDTVSKVILTATWKANPHTVTYKIVDSTDSWSTSAADYPVTEPTGNGASNPTAAISTETDAILDLRGENSVTRPGSKLVGWKDSGDNTEYRFAEGKVKYKVFDRDATLTPIFEEEEDYNVFFFTGDSVGATKVDTSTMPENQINIKYSAKNINTAAPTRPGYIFAGWSNDAGADLGDTVTSADYNKLAGFDATKKVVNLTAKWNKDTSFKVSYKDGVPSTSSTPFTGTLPADVPSLGFDDDVKQTELNVGGTDRVGFTFEGWRVTNDANGNVLAEVTSGYSTDAIYSELVGHDATIKAITFTAMWSGSPFTVTYHLTDGSWVTANIEDAGKNTPDEPLTYKCEQTVPLRLANTVKRDGYTLAGWANGTNKLAIDYIEYKFPTDVDFSMPAKNVDLYPLWAAKTYTVSFEEKPYGDTGSKPVDTASMPTNPQTGEYEDTFTYGAPTREGYDFGGWDIYRTNEYTADPENASILKHVGEGSGTYATLAGSADIDAITMVAFWTPKKVGVTYVLDIADNATWVKANIKDAGKDAPNMLVSYETDQSVNLREADTVSRNGYVLIGWKEDNSPTVTTAKYPFDSEGHASFTMPATNVVLYAVWQAKDGYTVKFEANLPTTNVVPGAEVEDMPADQPIAPAKLTWSGATSYVDTQSPTFAAYTFKGWEVYDSNGVKINTGDPLIGPGYYFNTLAITDTPEREHLTLKAVWELALIYNVIFKDGVDAGDTPVTDGTMPGDQTNISYVATVDYHAPSRVGYTFDGWDVLDITVPTDEQAMPSIAAADAGSAPYYTLAGNNVDRKKLQLTARWIEKTGYNVHFVDKPEGDEGATPVNMGSLTDLINIAWDDEVIAYPAPTRTGYDFVHWAVTDTTDPEDPANIGSATAGSYTYSKLARDRSDDTIMDITLTAIWKAHEWTVTYVNSSDKGLGTWVKANIGDAGKNTPDAPVTYAVDDKITLRDRTTLVMSGYKLIGWQDEEVETANTIKYMLDTVSEFLMPDHDVKLYPIWAPKVYTVIFDGNKPSEATDTSQIVTNLPPTQWAETDDGYPLAWNGDVDTHAPTLAGYSFKGWVIEDASTTGARTGLLNGATYKFSELALTDIMEHETLKLIAQWEPAKYRVNYVDPTDATGAAIATPAMIKTDDTKLWGDIVSDDDPWTIVSPAYAGKSNDDWKFLGWTVFDVNTNTYVALSAIANHAYSALATYENLTLADSATADETPALVLYASWARRVPFVVDFVKRDGSGSDTLESSETLVGLDGQIIETTVVDELGKTWKAYILNTVGPNHGIPGYKYNATLSDPFVVGTLDAKAAEPLHVKLIYTELADYTIVYDAAPGASVSDPTRHTSTKGSLKWEDAGSKFVPNDSEWAYVGHRIAGWTYGPTGVEFDFDPSVKFSAIAEAIYGTVDGTEGRDVDGDGAVEKPVTLFAKWAERTDYKVKYDDNYAVDDGKVKSGITDVRFLERVADATYTPATKEDVAWSATEIEPTETDKIKKPGVKDGIELYTIEGWNYLSKDGIQKPAEGLSFAQIVADMFDGEPTDNEITLYARYKEIAIEIKYTPVLSDDDGNVISTGASAAGTVSISLETPDAVTGTIQGSTATPNRGYHFVGWRRASDGEILLLNESGTLSGMASKIGYNVLPDGLGGATLLLAAQNTDDGYWHEEEYYALFAQNETAILHYDKNAEDATGSIPDVEAPYETLIDLSDGSGFQRTYWTLVSWNTKADGTGTTYALSQKDWEMPKGETTLYAQWVRNKAKLTYEPGGPDVTGIPDGVEDEWGTTHPVSDQQPKRDHYTFKGWNTKEDGTGTWWHPGDEIELPGDGIHLYAQWEINKYPVSIDPGPYTGGKVTYTDGGTYTVEHGGHLPEGYVTATPEPGYHVVGWRYTMTDEYGNVTTGIVSDPTELVVIGKVTFSAIFEADPVDEPMAPYEGYSGNGGLTPQTGDMNLVLVLAISGMAAMTLLLLIVAARRRRKEE